jgi:hypothetical protein
MTHIGRPALPQLNTIQSTLLYLYMTDDRRVSSLDASLSPIRPENATHVSGIMSSCETNLHLSEVPACA